MQNFDVTDHLCRLIMSAILSQLSRAGASLDDILSPRSPRALVAVLRVLLSWPRALHQLLLSRRHLEALAQHSRGDDEEALPVRTLAHLLLFAAGGDGITDTAAASFLPHILPHVAVDAPTDDLSRLSATDLHVVLVTLVGPEDAPPVPVNATPAQQRALAAQVRVAMSEAQLVLVDEAAQLIGEKLHRQRVQAAEDASRKPLGAADEAVARALRQLEQGDGRHPAALALLTRMSGGWPSAGATAETGSDVQASDVQASLLSQPTASVDLEARHAVDPDVQRAILAQLLSQPLRAEANLMSLVVGEPEVDGATEFSELSLTWKWAPTPQLAYGRGIVPLATLAPASPEFAAPTPNDPEAVAARERLRSFFIEQLRLMASVASGGHWAGARLVGRLLPLGVCLHCVRDATLSAGARAGFVRVLAAAHVPLVTPPGVAAAAAPMIAEGGQEGSEAVLALADEVLHELAARDVARTKLATAAATVATKREGRLVAAFKSSESFPILRCVVGNEARR